LPVTSRKEGNMIPFMCVFLALHSFTNISWKFEVHSFARCIAWLTMGIEGGVRSECTYRIMIEGRLVFGGVGMVSNAALQYILS